VADEPSAAGLVDALVALGRGRPSPPA